MPAVPFTDDDAISQLERLAPRDANAAPLIARQPAMEYTSGGAIALNAPSDRSAFEKRDIVQGIIPTYYKVDGPPAGTVVGIVLGSVLGFLLLGWLLYSLANINNNSGANIQGEEEIVVRKKRNSHSGRSRRSTRTEVREYSRSPRRRSQIIVEERRAPPPQMRARSRSIIVEDRARVPGDDVVEVIEEHDDYRARRGSRRSGGGYRY